jgi:hypothetical protein
VERVRVVDHRNNYVDTSYCVAGNEDSAKSRDLTQKSKRDYLSLDLHFRFPVRSAVLGNSIPVAHGGDLQVDGDPLFVS